MTAIPVHLRTVHGWYFQVMLAVIEWARRTESVAKMEIDGQCRTSMLNPV